MGNRESGIGVFPSYFAISGLAEFMGLMWQGNWVERAFPIPDSLFPTTGKLLSS